MSGRDEYNSPSPEQELHSPQREFSPVGDEHPRPSSGGKASSGKKKQRSRVWIYAAVILLVASADLAPPEKVPNPEPLPVVSVQPVSTEETKPAPTTEPTTEPTTAPTTEPTTEPTEPTTEPTTESTLPLTDAEILLAQGTWSTGTGLIVHFDAGGGGWWTYEGIAGLMSWWEDEDGHVAYSGYACYKAAFETESGPRLKAKTGSCSGTVYLNRGEGQYSITMDNPFELPETQFNGSGSNSNNAALATLYGKTAEEVIKGSNWQLSELEGNDERLALAIEDKNPYNRQVIWPSGLSLAGENAVLSFSDIYGGTQDYPCSCKQLNEYKFLLTPIIEEEVGENDWAFKYPIVAPEGGAYSDAHWGYPNRIACYLAYSETGLILLADNPFASWLYQDDVCIMALAQE